MKKFLIYLIMASPIVIKCSSKQPAWFESVKDLMIRANQTLETLVARAEKAEKIDDYISILEDYANALKQTGNDFKKLTEKYPEINKNKDLLEKQLADVYVSLRKNLLKLQTHVSEWQKKNKNNTRLREAIKNASAASSQAEKETRPMEEYN